MVSATHTLTIFVNEPVLGDCFELMKLLPDKSIDMILCDLPYGITPFKWDVVLPIPSLWKEYERIIKDNGAIILTAVQPFTASLVNSNPKLFRYSLVWDKVNKYTGSLNANKMPMRRHEDILVFYKKLPVFNKQYRNCQPRFGMKMGGHGSYTKYSYPHQQKRLVCQDGKHGNPYSILSFKGQVKENGLHPTQKPVALFEYLIKTYSNEGDLILDNCAGSMTTAIACLNTHRNFICMEKDTGYYETGKARINVHREMIQSAGCKSQEKVPNHASVFVKSSVMLGVPDIHCTHE